jgi:protein-tyrosine phosphatase
MIDLHAHILPGLDDGARTMDESLAMSRVATNDGIEIVVATPHTGNGIYFNPRHTVLAAVEALNSRLQVEGIPLTVLPGADVYIQEDLVELLKDGEILTINDNMRYVNVEFPRHVMPPRYLDWMFRLLLAGFTPVFTHPERNSAVQRNPDILREWVEKGGLVQVTAMSLTGGFGREIEKCCKELMKLNLAHVFASDAHSATRRPPVLSKAFEIAETLVGTEYTRRMIEDHPRAIITGRTFSVPEPVERKRGFFARLCSKNQRSEDVAR